MLLAFAAEPARAILIGREIHAGEVDRLSHLRDQAKRAPAAQREAAWYGVARYALDLSTAMGGTRKDRSAARAILKEACDRLPASTLAAVAAWGQHPTVSEAFARAIEAVDVRGRGPDVSAKAEAGSECRDALARFGPVDAPELVKIWQQVGPAGFAAGGASASVYRIVLFGSEFADSASADAAFAAGFREGVAGEAGPRTSRFAIVARETPRTHVPWRKFAVEESYQSGAGVFVVASGSAEADMVSGLGAAGGVIAVDARDPRSIPPEDDDVLPESNDPSGAPLDLGPQLFLNADLGYRSWRNSEENPAANAFHRWQPNFLSAPIGLERARRLARWIVAQTQLDTIAVALPEAGGDIAFARACMSILPRARANGTFLIVPIVYSAGRRAYTAEVKQLRSSGCQAIVLCGPGEESAEWLLALRAAKFRPLVFGGSELDPEGFHDAVRSAAEGAVFVDSDWRARGTLRERLGEASRSTGRAPDDRDFERGFLVGRSIARRIVEGSFTPGLLRDALEDESPRILGFAQRFINPGNKPAEPGSAEVDVPLYRIRNGMAERLEFP